jgi:hypothetical protein
MAPPLINNGRHISFPTISSIMVLSKRIFDFEFWFCCCVSDLKTRVFMVSLTVKYSVLDSQFALQCSHHLTYLLPMKPMHCIVIGS